VSVDGDTALISARNNDDGGTDSGSAYAFVRSGTSWSQQQKLTAADAAAGDHFGGVSVSDDTALIGAPDDDDGGTDSGSAYVFLRSGTTWSQQQKLTASAPAAGDHFGGSVSVSNDTALVSAIGDDDFGQSSGAAYIFVRSGTTWSEQQKLTASDPDQFEGFAAVVSVSGDIALIGAPSDDDGGNTAGSAYVFLRSGSAWSQEQKLTASDAAPSDIFGYSVSVSGDTALVGAPSDDDDSGGNSGSAYAFLRSELDRAAKAHRL